MPTCLLNEATLPQRYGHLSATSPLLVRRRAAEARASDWFRAVTDKAALVRANPLVGVDFPGGAVVEIALPLLAIHECA